LIHDLYIEQQAKKIWSNRWRLKSWKKVNETILEQIVRLTGFDRIQCPFCKTGIIHTVELLPRIRSPGNVLFKKYQLIF